MYTKYSKRKPREKYEMYTKYSKRKPEEMYKMYTKYSKQKPREKQGCNVGKVISELYTSFVLQCTVSGR